MVPLGSVADVQDSAGPIQITRYNMFPAASINGASLPGVSTGEAIGSLEKLAQKLPRNMTTEWTELSYLQKQEGKFEQLRDLRQNAYSAFVLGVILVYFVLAGLYESWSLPLSVILVVPMTLLSGDRAGGLYVWSLDSDSPLATVQQPGAIYTVAISPDGRTLATAGTDKVIRLWSADSLKQRLVLEGHSGPVYGVSFSADGTTLASAGWDDTIRLWDPAAGTLLKSWNGEGGDIWSIAFSPTAARLATGNSDGSVRLWDASAVPGQFLLKDVVLLGAALWTLGESLRAVQEREND